LQQGTEVTITQALGGSYTVNIYGNLARIDAKDAEALGQPPQKKLSATDLESSTLEELLWSQMRTCYDPEIPVNIVDLGLIYDCKVVSQTDNKKHVEIKMTLTAPGCGMGPAIAADVQNKILEVPTVESVNIELVFDPPWSYDMMSDVAKLQLGVI
jgi:probable FeS assembly SUF system protein SufT